MRAHVPIRSLAVAIALAAAGAGPGAADRPAPRTRPAGTVGVRLQPYVQDGKHRFAYGLHVAPPWPGGGHLVVNFPEHMEYSKRTLSVLRYHDKVTGEARWVVAPDGTSATLDVESPHRKGVFVVGRARVVGKDRIDVSMKIVNKTRRPLPVVRSLYCFQYRRLKGFPAWRDNLRHNFVVEGGKLVAVADVRTTKRGAIVKGGNVTGSPDRDKAVFVTRRGGWIEGGVDAGVVAVNSLDGKRAVVVAWTPGRSVLFNGAIPCAHADPYYGDIAPGRSAEAKGVILFTQRPVRTVVKELVAAGLGAPPKARPAATRPAAD